MKFSEVVHQVLPLANAIQAYWEAELPKRYSNYPLVNPGEEDGPPPPEQQQLADLLAGLPEEYVYQLLLLFQFGRVRFDTSDFTRWYKKLKSTFPDLSLTVSYLVENFSLGENLSKALEELQQDGIDLDDILHPPVPTGR